MRFSGQIWITSVVRLEDIPHGAAARLIVKRGPVGNLNIMLPGLVRRASIVDCIGRPVALERSDCHLPFERRRVILLLPSLQAFAPLNDRFTAGS